MALTRHIKVLPRAAGESAEAFEVRLDVQIHTPAQASASGSPGLKEG